MTSKHNKTFVTIKQIFIYPKWKQYQIINWLWVIFNLLKSNEKLPNEFISFCSFASVEIVESNLVKKGNFEVELWIYVVQIWGISITNEKVELHFIVSFL